jgi:RNA polymerase sigma factor (TIGR02999 family)
MPEADVMSLGHRLRMESVHMVPDNLGSNAPDPDPAADGPDVTGLLADAAAGKPMAARDLLPLVYRSLRELAERRMKQERLSHTLQATALVHEVYLRLVGDKDLGWNSRAHFYAAAAEAMRRILIEHARRIGAKKRGGDRRREIANVADLSQEDCLAEAIDMDAAVEALSKHDARAATVAQLRFYTGLSVDETAAAMNIAPSTVDREWRYARAWLLRFLNGTDTPETSA